MTGVFEAYAAYYDLLYRDKDYDRESGYIDALIRCYAPTAQDILELGCGTGAHAVQLATRGYRITGIDLSDAMVQQARARAAPAQGLAPEFVQGDLRDYRTERRFDAVLALFHVMSYQVTNADLAAAMQTAAVHLRPGGLFIFDCWYGPGVLTDPPVTRVRRLQGDGVSITRIAEPVHHPNENRVDVHYDILVEGPPGLDRIQEVHSMRYLFAPETDLLLAAARLRRTSLSEWMGDEVPTVMTWNACVVARKTELA